MKAIMKSFSPQICEKIANDKLRELISKTVPKCGVPFKCYIYCTGVKNMPLSEYVKIHRATSGKIDDWHGKVIGEFVCETVRDYASEEFPDYDILDTYGTPCYGLYISDLKIYDTPKELGEFKTVTRCKDWRCFDMCSDVCGYAENNQCDYGMVTKRLTRPPATFCCVEKLSE